jgi:Tfp pilus assembly protein FimT
MIVLVIVAVVGAVALPTITAISKRRQEIETAGGAHSLLHTARDTAYKQLHCVEVRDDNATGKLIAEEVPCLPGDDDAGPPPVIETVIMPTDVVQDVTISGTGRFVFQPSGGLAVGSPARVLHIMMDSGRETWFEVQPALGTIRECKSYDARKDPACMQ